MKEARIIVLAGQSNAVGVGFTKYLPEHFDGDTVAAFHRGYERIRISYVPTISEVMDLSRHGSTAPRRPRTRWGPRWASPACCPARIPTRISIS